MMTTGTIDSGRSRWQFLFPEGLREEYPRPGGQSVVTTYSPRWCQGIVDRFRRFRAASEAYGMPAQPLPVQIQHVGVHGTGSIEDRRRVGSIYDLVYVPRGGTIPGGVWALIEWTVEGLEMINSGKFNCLSPTNSSFGTLSTGERIPGDFLVEVSLVDVPFLEAIGTAADYLPFNAIPYTGSRSTNAIARSAMPAKRTLPPAWLAAHDDGLVIARGAQFRSLPMEPTESVEIEVSPDVLTPEVVAAMLGTEAARMKMREMCREMCREMMESDLDGLLEARGYMKREMAAPTLPDLTEAADIVAQARAIEEEVIAGEVKELVRSGRLLAAHVGDFVARRKVGDKVDGLLRDWSGASTMQGVAGTTPREKAPASSGRLTADHIMKAVERELIARGKGYTYAEHLRIAKTRINDARSKGELVEG